MIAHVPDPETQAILALCPHASHHTDCTACNIRAQGAGTHLAKLAKNLIEALSK